MRALPPAPARASARAPRAFPWGRVTLAWAGVALFFVVHSATIRLREGDPALTLFSLVQGLHWFSWALATPLVVWATRRFPLVAGRWGRRLVVHAGLVVGISVTLSLLNAAVSLVVGYVEASGAPSAGEFAVQIVISSLAINALVYTAVVAGTTALDGRRRADRLEAELARAHLQALRAQLNPHFLFNALQTASALTAPADQRARRVLRDLGDLLRLSFERSDAQEVLLDEELGFLDRYLSIERVRFQDRLTVDVEVDDGAYGALVPSLLLQPLVENAVKHGVGPCEGPVRIGVEVRRHGGRLSVRVADDGGGAAGAAGAAGSTGVGLANVGARLRALYGADAALAHGPGGRPDDRRGYVVQVDLPFRTRAEAVRPGARTPALA